MVNLIAPKTDQDRILIGRFLQAMSGTGKFPAKKHQSRMTNIIIQEMLKSEKEGNKTRAENLHQLHKKVCSHYNGEC